mgnify:CR=1 FL=1
MTHTPYRARCPHCVRARGRNTPHYKGKSDEEVEIPRKSFDYFFLTKEDETGNKNPMVVMVDESSGENTQEVCPKRDWEKTVKWNGWWKT